MLNYFFQWILQSIGKKIPLGGLFMLLFENTGKTILFSSLIQIIIWYLPYLTENNMDNLGNIHKGHRGGGGGGGVIPKRQKNSLDRFYDRPLRKILNCIFPLLKKFEKKKIVLFNNFFFCLKPE